MSLANNMIAKDGADHRRLRSLVNKAFARRNIDSMSDRMATHAQQQFESAESIAKRDGQVEYKPEAHVLMLRIFLSR